MVSSPTAARISRASSRKRSSSRPTPCRAIRGRCWRFAEFSASTSRSLRPPRDEAPNLLHLSAKVCQHLIEGLDARPSETRKLEIENDGDGGGDDGHEADDMEPAARLP